ncbi:MAG: CDP-glucose 4,6-dehydratase [Candidatus Margulisiibacteriota bacterium]|nr:CDP-glucose 4,6-dehydratase [Candidatus Margulisiibacteriota bacterium]
MNNYFWKKKRVFITGHTGFKGSWLCLWFYLMGAEVVGYALQPPTRPSLFKLCRIDKLVKSIIGDVRDLKKLKRAMLAAKPEIVFHMAAQPIVRESYKVPVDTFNINVVGTVNVLEAARSCRSIKVIVNVTTDKVYEESNENRVTSNGYKESDKLGGYDPYAGSKACSEIVSSVYRRSYSMNIATARAGNVIGGGDWAGDRLIPDFVRALISKRKVKLRNPKATRPWQHVLEPLSGYLMLAEKLYKKADKYSGAWNFGPDDRDSKTVGWVVNKLMKKLKVKNMVQIDKKKHPHETKLLKLNSKKSRKELGWRPKWGIDKAIDKIVEWTNAYQRRENVASVCMKQIEEYPSPRLVLDRLGLGTPLHKVERGKEGMRQKGVVCKRKRN